MRVQQPWCVGLTAVRTKKALDRTGCGMAAIPGSKTMMRIGSCEATVVRRHVSTDGIAPKDLECLLGKIPG